jgi:hypothetical protein
MTYFETLNPTIEACNSFGHGDELEDEGNTFGVGASFEESSQAFVTRTLSLFRRLSIPPTTYENPLAWCCNHEGQFSNVAFMAKHIIRILGSQIETKRVFSLARVLTTLWRCHLQVENLDRIITIVKNRLDDPRVIVCQKRP